MVTGKKKNKETKDTATIYKELMKINKKKYNKKMAKGYLHINSQNKYKHSVNF